MNILDKLNKEIESVGTLSIFTVNTGRVICARTTSKLLAKMTQYESDFNCKLTPVNFSKG